MQHDRHLRLLAEHGRDAAAVIADGRLDAGDPASRRVRERAAPAIADDADRPGACHRLHRRLDVGERVVELGLGADVGALRDVVRRIGELDALADAIEKRGRDRKITLRGIAVGDALDVMVDAEYLLQHHHGALRLARGHSLVGRDRRTVLRRQLQRLAHAVHPIIWWKCRDRGPVRFRWPSPPGRADIRASFARMGPIFAIDDMREIERDCQHRPTAGAG